MKRIVSLFAVLTLAGCNNPDALTFEDALFLRNVQPMPVPTDAQALWTKVEACSGLKGDFASVRWLLAPDGIKRHGKWVAAIWTAGDNAIVLSPPYTGDTLTIKHEEMHALLHGGTDHPHQFFIDGPCGNLMSPVDPSRFP